MCDLRGASRRAWRRDLHVQTTAHRPCLRPVDRGRRRPVPRARRRRRRRRDRGAARKPSAARTALLTRGGGPDGSAVVALNRWRYRADPLNRGLSAGWSSGDWRGREVRVPHSPNGRAHAGEAGRRAYAGSVGWYAREIDAPVAGQYSLQFESAHYRAQVYVDGKLLRSHTGAYEPFSARPTLTPGRHTVAVRVDWRDPQRQSDEDWQRAWFNYGGLNRPVTLSRLGPSRLGALTLRTRLTASGRARVTSRCACATARTRGASSRPARSSTTATKCSCASNR